jgi:rod shape-determining protein MreC
MPIGGDRYASRVDTLVFIGCLALAFVALSLPEGVRDPIARTLRQTVLAPFLQIQQASGEFRMSRARFAAVTAQRDSAALAASFLPELRRENERLRALLGLRGRLRWGYVPAEVLHQSEPTSALSLVVAAGRMQGVRPLTGVVDPAGLVGLVRSVDAHTSIVLTWAHPDFRASAQAADGTVFGIVAPHGTSGPGAWLLELRGVPYREQVAPGTMIVTSGLGGVYPRGIPLGTVVGIVGEATGWERTYLLRPAVHPAGVTHVMILMAGRGSSGVAEAFDSATAGTAAP